ncbi:MAG: phosphoenolpyruvate carboxylase [Phycisphaerales bacterium]
MIELDRGRIDEALSAAVREGPGAAAAELAAELAQICREGEAGVDRAADRIASETLDSLVGVVRFVTARFHLYNKAEQLNIAWVNREREKRATPESPRAESIAEAVQRLARAGLSAAEASAAFAGLRIEPTLTAHPTEARRRTILDKQLEIAGCLMRLRSDELLPRERSGVERRLHELVALLLVTDDVRARRLEVVDEAKNGLYFLTTSIWQTVPELLRDAQLAARETYGIDLDPAAPELATVLRYRTWIGGDRDGNPRVTHEVTQQVLDMMRQEGRRLWEEELLQLQRNLSISSRRTAVADLDDPETPAEIEHASVGHRRFEPIRLRLIRLRAALAGDRGFDASRLVEELLDIRRQLESIGLDLAARGSLLEAAIIRAKVFGLHLATMDIRQHSGVHEAAVSELLSAGTVHPSYASLDEPAKVELLSRELQSPRPLRNRWTPLSDATSELLATLETVRAARLVDPLAVRCYIISMAHGVSDVLEVLLLLKEAGLFRVQPDGSCESEIEVVPLFETIDDLRRGPDLVREMLQNTVFARHLDAVCRGADRSVEIMLGYSDSNKDGGFLMANTALQEAQAAITDAAAAHGARARFFHGRGGTVGRGGGRAGRAILAAPKQARSGSMRFTEQGEVISFRYALPAIAHRHLEQIISAALIAGADPSLPGDPPEVMDLVRRAAETGMRAYRSLIDDPGFWPWFSGSTPISHIAGLPIASRPVSRSSGDQLTFGSLRAIPWVFSWIQIRALVPGWYGIGTAFSGCSGEERAMLTDAARTSPFLATVLSNAAQELARARMPIMRRYAILGPGGEGFASRIEAEYALASRQVLELTGQTSLLQFSPVIEEAIDSRNAWTDVLNLIQIELLRRERAGAEPAEDLAPALQATVNGVAAAMQSTG